MSHCRFRCVLDKVENSGTLWSLKRIGVRKKISWIFTKDHVLIDTKVEEVTVYEVFFKAGFMDRIHVMVAKISNYFKISLVQI